jgi:hypothetical protein
MDVSQSQIDYKPKWQYYHWSLKTDSVQQTVKTQAVRHLPNVFS